MTNQQHPITPPPELVEQWADMLSSRSDHAVFSLAARWGADQELEACKRIAYERGLPDTAAALQRIRRPKPPSLKEQALAALKRQAVRSVPSLIATEDCDTIRKALEALPND